MRARSDLLIADAQTAGNTGAKRFDHDIRFIDQAQQCFHASWLLQIECEAFLAAAGVGEKYADAIARFADMAHRLAFITDGN